MCHAFAPVYETSKRVLFCIPLGRGFGDRNRGLPRHGGTGGPGGMQLEGGRRAHKGVALEEGWSATGG